ncbi:hypothetical protein FZC33_29085 [Labrys sp. KNU-23]|uniref:hypothetical protein n=1 Tax=Labrys sp. KNU-23 TaxID=2789216 RepID=UPI0011EC83DB|nr:hypothetical protein [Labrys sp. KNU-23]QEN90115.1 hypothetical protein FZC33_29085 [Labrys sp. KNU-23]
MAKGAGFAARAAGAFVFVVFAKRYDPFSNRTETPDLAEDQASSCDLLEHKLGLLLQRSTIKRSLPKWVMPGALQGEKFGCSRVMTGWRRSPKRRRHPRLRKHRLKIRRAI